MIDDLERERVNVCGGVHNVIMLKFDIGHSTELIANDDGEFCYAEDVDEALMINTVNTVSNCISILVKQNQGAAANVLRSQIKKLRRKTYSCKFAVEG